MRSYFDTITMLFFCGMSPVNLLEQDHVKWRHPSMIRSLYPSSPGQAILPAFGLFRLAETEYLIKR